MYLENAKKSWYAIRRPISNKVDAKQKENPLVYPRPYVAGRGRKDWRGKSPEYSDPDLPELVPYVDD